MPPPPPVAHAPTQSAGEEKPHEADTEQIALIVSAPVPAPAGRTRHTTLSSSDAIHHLSSVRVGEYEADGLSELEDDSTGSRERSTQDESQAAHSAPRLAVKPVHTLIALLILLAALSTSLTLLLQQTVNIAQVSGSQPTEQSMTQSPDDGQAGEGGGQADQDVQSTDSGENASSEQTSGSQDSAQSTNSPGATPDSTDTRIDLNTASVEELQTLSGVGPVMSQRIIDHRTQIGGYTSVDELLDVKGIGTKTLENLRPMVKVS